MDGQRILEKKGSAAVRWGGIPARPPPGLWPSTYGPTGPQPPSFPLFPHSSRTSSGSCTWSGNGQINCRSGCRTSSPTARAARVRDRTAGEAEAWGRQGRQGRLRRGEAELGPEGRSCFTYLTPPGSPASPVPPELGLSFAFSLHLSLLSLSALSLSVSLSPFCCVSFSPSASLCHLCLSLLFSPCFLSLVLFFSPPTFFFSLFLSHFLSLFLSFFFLSCLCLCLSSHYPFVQTFTPHPVSKSLVSILSFYK